ncbi:MAG: NAD(P)-dependent oxidoreductase [Gordonia sp.]|nr:NAD(P)-dependent oxidoreductase [Gordonia sp. (in: high G+C Gram-positive bacteria)]
MTDCTIGFIGAGLIGEPMIGQLIKYGHHTTAFARRAEVRDRLDAAGAVAIDQIADLAGSDVIISCLFNDEQLGDLCVPIIRKMRPGTIFVSHTTGSPATIQSLQAVAESVGVYVVEAPFSGGAIAVRNRELTVFLAGVTEAVDRAEAILRSYASTIIRTGEHGTALTAKLLNNTLFAAITQLTLEALRAAESTGIAEDTMLKVLSASSGGSRSADYIMASGQTTADYADHLPHYLSKDLASVREVTAEVGLDIAKLLVAVDLGPMNLSNSVVSN